MMKSKLIVRAVIVLIIAMLFGGYASNGLATPIGQNYLPDWEYYNFSEIWEQGTDTKPVYLAGENRYEFYLDNSYREDLTKHVWFYMEYTMPDNSGWNPENGFEYTTAPAGTQGRSNTTGMKSEDLGNGLSAYTWEFDIFPQPDREWVFINTGLFGTNPINITYANMYSQCVPEPATASLFVLGIIGLAGIARRK